MIGERLSFNSIVTTNKNVIFCDLDGEAAMLNMDDGVYYGLNVAGATIWNLIQEPKTVKEILEKFLEEYEVEEESLQRRSYYFAPRTIRKWTD